MKYQSTPVDQIMSFDRSSRSWVVERPDGDVETFGSGGRAKGFAFRTAVRILRPALFEMGTKTTERFPELSSRVWKAIELVMNGDVEIMDRGSIVARVRSQSSPADYTVSAIGGILYCNCPDSGFRLPSGNVMCKHSLSYVFARKLSELDNSPY